MATKFITKADGAFYTCGVCGEPASMLARDVLRHEVPSKPFIEFSPVGALKAGCDKHPVTSEEHVTQLERR